MNKKGCLGFIFILLCISLTFSEVSALKLFDFNMALNPLEERATQSFDAETGDVVYINMDSNSTVDLHVKTTYLLIIINELVGVKMFSILINNSDTYHFRIVNTANNAVAVVNGSAYLNSWSDEVTTTTTTTVITTDYTIPVVEKPWFILTTTQILLIVLGILFIPLAICVRKNLGENFGYLSEFEHDELLPKGWLDDENDS